MIGKVSTNSYSTRELLVASTGLTTVGPSDPLIRFIADTSSWSDRLVQLTIDQEIKFKL